MLALSGGKGAAPPTKKGAPLRVRLFCESQKLGCPAVRLGTADNDLAAHEVGAVELFHGELGRFEFFHFDEAEALGAAALAVHDHFDVFHGADLGEQVEQVAFGGVIGQVADVELGAGDFLWNGRFGREFLARGTFRTLRFFADRFGGVAAAVRAAGGFGLDAEPTEDLFQEAGFFLAAGGIALTAVAAGIIATIASTATAAA